MDMNFFVPVNVITGAGCVRANGDVFAKAGKKCLIVTGKTAAKKSGALDDLTWVLESIGTQYAIFDAIEQNPSYETCVSAAKMAKEEKADFIVGIGGGSPIDAAKAIAVLAVCGEMNAETLYSGKWDANPLPIIAIGTTAGTGSEVTPVSVITTPQGLKKSFRAPTLYPVASFGDATYTLSLSDDFTRSTALDALCHCMESYFNRTANDMSKTFAMRGICILAEMLCKTANCQGVSLTFEDREKLYAASLYGGYAISVTGTAFPHAMGYFLSEQYNIPHGNACAVYLEEFIKYNCEVAPATACELFDFLRIDTEELVSLVKANLPKIDVKLTKEKIAELGPRYENNKSLTKCYGDADRNFAEKVLAKLFG